MMMGMMGWGVQQQGWRKGPWTPEEDELLTQYVKLHGEGRWSSVSRSSGLNRSGKSCRLRWVNYLRPGLKKGHITPQEEGIIIELHAIWGNKWSTIARYLPGRTDNEIKNYWRTHFKKRDRSFKKRKPQLLRQQNWHQMPGMHGPSNEENGSIYQEKCSQHHQPQQHQQQQQVQQENPTFEAQTTGYSCIMDPTPDINHGDYMLSKEITSSSSWSDFRIDEDLWDGLWNFDDPSSFDHHASYNYNKVAAMCINQLPSPTTAVYEGNPYHFNNGVNYIIQDKTVQD